MSKCNCTPLVLEDGHVIHKIDCPAMTQPNNTTDTELEYEMMVAIIGDTPIEYNENGRRKAKRLRVAIDKYAAQEANKARITSRIDTLKELSEVEPIHLQSHVVNALYQTEAQLTAENKHAQGSDLVKPSVFSPQAIINPPTPAEKGKA